jgi:hypothetical protein
LFIIYRNGGCPDVSKILKFISVPVNIAIDMETVKCGIRIKISCLVILDILKIGKLACRRAINALCGIIKNLGFGMKSNQA